MPDHPSERQSLAALAARIVSDPAICGGRPVVRGTRMRVVDILDLLSAGATRAEILDDFDYLSDEDISAALVFAADAVNDGTVKAA